MGTSYPSGLDTFDTTYPYSNYDYAHGDLYAAIVALQTKLGINSSSDATSVDYAVQHLNTTYQPLDADLTALAALSTTSFGRSLLTQADAAATRTTIGAGTSSFSGAYADLSGIPSTFTPAAHNQAFSTITSTPTTLAGYGVTDAQPLDADLTALAGLTSAADKLPYFTGSGTAGVASFTAAGRALVDDTDAATQRTTLGLGTLATQSGTFSGTASGTNTGDQTTVSGNAGTATALQTTRAINGVNFDGSGDITVTAAASTLTGATLAGNVLASSITSVGTLSGGATGAGFTIALTTSTLTGSLPLANMTSMASNTILGNATILPATPLALPASTVKTMLAIASTDVSGLGTLATQSGTFSGTSSGTNTGDQTFFADLRTPTGDVTISADSSLIVLRRFALTAGRKLTLNSSSLLRIAP